MVNLLRPCKGGSYVHEPDSRLHIDLERAKARFEEEGYAIVMDLDIMLIVKRGVETTIYPSGKLVFKTHDEEEAREAFEGVRRVLPELSLLS